MVTSGCGSLFLFLFLAYLAPSSVVQGCSCLEGSFRVPISDAIRNEFCSSYNTDVYVGMVVGATCNCVPQGEPDMPSSFLNCQDYQLEQDSISATILTRGQCSFERFDSSYLGGGGVCSELGNALSGLTVEAPAVIDDELLNLTRPFEGCRYACPFNMQDDYPYVQQPCVYTVRVMEVFKGNYSVDDVIEVAGPDVLTSCGAPGRVLQISTAYVAGIGQACSPVSEWAKFSDYREGEMELLRRLREEEVECGATAAVVSVTMVMTFALITAIM